MSAGPYPLTQLRVMADAGNLSPDDRIRRHDSQQWRRAAEVPHVFDGVAAEWTRSVQYFGPAVEEEREPADFAQRFVAWWVDGVLVWFAALMIAGPCSRAINTAVGAHITNWNEEIANTLIKLFFLVALGWAYEALQESSIHQATLGKRLVAIRVTDTEGKRLSLATATARYFSKFVSLVSVYGYFAALVTERRRALHDLMAKTLVVKGPERGKMGL
jgi:uncharacterized RDD family membrane protein YckC